MRYVQQKFPTKCHAEIRTPGSDRAGCLVLFSET